MCALPVHVAGRPASVRRGRLLSSLLVRDFYDLPSGIEIQKPDEFLANLFDLDPSRMMDVFYALASRYRTPPMDVWRIVEALGLRELGELVRARLDRPG